MNITAETPIHFGAAPGEEVVVTGADLLSGWRQADETRPIFHVAWPHKVIGWNRSMAHPDDEYHRIVGRWWCWPGTTTRSKIA